jgi:hypothetical protein
MTRQSSASGRFASAIKQRNLFGAEIAMRELGSPSLLNASTTWTSSRRSNQRGWSARRCVGAAGSSLRLR